MVDKGFFNVVGNGEQNECEFDFGRNCAFYKCELAEEYMQFKEKHRDFAMDSISYNQDELKNGCIMRQVKQIECGKLTVADGVGDHYKIDTDCQNEILTNTEERWEPLQPVFISAQMGQGKNYFIENTLLPYVRELNHRKQTKQKVLILSNRLALKQQIKEHLSKHNNTKDNGNQVYSLGEFADVMTYQSLLYRQDY